MAVYAAFPRSIRLLRACCSRVTHPCAGRRQKYCYSLAAPRLACVKPAASVHPEPGSNSSLYIFYLYSSSTILTSSSLKGIYALMYFVLPYTSHTFFQVCCLSLSLFQSTVVRFPNGIAKVLLFSFPPNFSGTFFHRFPDRETGFIILSCRQGGSYEIEKNFGHLHHPHPTWMSYATALSWHRPRKP